MALQACLLLLLLLLLPPVGSTMHIAFLSTQSLTSPSGLGRYWPVSKELVRLGYQVTILALHHNLPSIVVRRSVQDGVDVWYVSQMHVRKIGHHKRYFSHSQLLWVSALATWRLMAGAFRIPADIYHLCKPHPMNGLAIMLPRALGGRPVYLDCDDYEAATGRFAGQWQKRVVTCFEDRLPRMAAGVTVNTRFTFERLVGLGYPADRIVYVPNGVDRDRFSSVDQHSVYSLCSQLGLVDRKIVLYVGSMSLASHAVDLLLHSFAIVRRTRPQTTLLLVGGGEDYGLLQSRAESLGLGESVRFVGRVPPDVVPIYYRLAEVTVDPAYDDPGARARFPLKLVESLASGIPVVTGHVGDRPMLLSRGGGLLVRPGDAAALAEGILAILGDDSLRTSLSEQALQVREQYYWDRLVQDWVQVYECHP